MTHENRSGLSSRDMTTTVRALVIEPSGDTRQIQTPTTPQALQELVGGWLEAINGDGWHAYFDEEGGMKQLDRNPLATHLLHDLGWRGQWIVGPVVFLGTTPSGDEADVPSSVTRALARP